MNIPRPPVLLVDDDKNLVDALALQLRHDFDVTTATSPAVGLELARTKPFAAVVSDLRMPEMSGVAFLESVKLVSPATGRILLTGNGDLSSAVAAVNEASVHGFLVKPATPGAVRDALRKAISTNAVDGDALAQLGQRAALGGLAGAIGHEIGNLLAALSGSIEAVRESVADGSAPDDDAIACLDLVNLRLAEHARQLRDLSKPRPLVIDNHDVSQLVVETIGLLQRSGVLRHVSVTTDLPLSAPLARIDRSMIEGVLINLVKNGVEAFAAKLDTLVAEGHIPSEQGRIEIRVRTDGDHVCVDVADNGCGIPHDRIARLFEPHRTTKGARGNGLGLSIARASVERQGGAVRVMSTVNVGTTFTIQIPAAS